MRLKAGDLDFPTHLVVAQAARTYHSHGTHYAFDLNLNTGSLMLARILSIIIKALTIYTGTD